MFNYIGLLLAKIRRTTWLGPAIILGLIVVDLLLYSLIYNPDFSKIKSYLSWASGIRLVKTEKMVDSEPGELSPSLNPTIKPTEIPSAVPSPSIIPVTSPTPVASVQNSETKSDAQAQPANSPSNTTPTPTPTATPTPTPTPTPVLSPSPSPSPSVTTTASNTSPVYIQAYLYNNNQQIVAEQFPVKVFLTSGELFASAETDHSGKSPTWNIPANTSVKIYLYPKQGGCGELWELTTGALGTLETKTLSIQGERNPCITL